MLVISAFFLIWAFTRPLGEQLAESESEQGGGGPGQDVPGADRGDEPRPE